MMHARVLIWEKLQETSEINMGIPQVTSQAATDGPEMPGQRWQWGTLKPYGGNRTKKQDTGKYKETIFRLLILRDSAPIQGAETSSPMHMSNIACGIQTPTYRMGYFCFFNTNHSLVPIVKLGKPMFRVLALRVKFGTNLLLVNLKSIRTAWRYMVTRLSQDFWDLTSLNIFIAYWRIARLTSITP